jgi:hypothetical protein
MTASGLAFDCLELDSVTGYIAKVAESGAACQTSGRQRRLERYFSFLTLISLKNTMSLSLWFCRPM